MWQAIDMAEAFSKAGYHKQIVNRLLEPFSHITVVVTGTQWSNFLTLGDHPDAEPHIQILAQRVREALDSAEVQTLKQGEWHLPFIKDEERREAYFGPSQSPATGWLKKISVARCASTRACPHLSHALVTRPSKALKCLSNAPNSFTTSSPRHRRRTYRHSSTKPKPMDTARDTKVPMANGEPAF